MSAMATELDQTLDDLLEELQSLSPKDTGKPRVYEETDSGVPPVSTPSARPPAQSQPPPPVEEDLPKIRNIYDELKPQSLGEPPPKPPRQGQGSPPQTKRKQPTTNGVAPSSREGRGPPPAANVSELDALLETLGSNVQQNADITSGGVRPGSPQVGSERSLDDMLEELQSMDQAPSEGKRTQQPADMSPNDPTPVKQGGGSTTTKKLDALLVELSTFKPALPQSPPAQPQSAVDAEYSVVRREDKRESRAPKPPATVELDSMLAELGSEVKSKGVDTTLKGCCAACSKPIHGKLLTAMNRTWHPEHFVCAICEQELANQAFYELEGRPYCEKDYNEMLAPRCGYCNGPILERCINAMNKSWHPDHFFCSLCGKPFEEDNFNFYEKDGKPYCKEDYFDQFAPTCKRCDRAVMGGYLSAVGSYWHRECFTCKSCNKSFPKMNFFEHEGQPYCEHHYHEARGSLCAKCEQPILRDCVNAMGKKFHPEHFACAFCMERLKLGNFKEHRGNAYCSPCHDKLFG